MLGWSDLKQYPDELLQLSMQQVNDGVLSDCNLPLYTLALRGTQAPFKLSTGHTCVYYLPSEAPFSLYSRLTLSQ